MNREQQFIAAMNGFKNILNHRKVVDHFLAVVIQDSLVSVVLLVLVEISMSVSRHGMSVPKTQPVPILLVHTSATAVKEG